MRLGGRLAAAIEIMEDMERRHRPAADALKDWGLSHRFAGAGDRAAIGNIVYDALRHRRSAAWRLGSDTPRAAAIGALFLDMGLTEDRFVVELDGDRFAPPPLTADEIAAIRGRDIANAPDAVRADCPDWCVPLLARSYGDAWVEEVIAMAARPPLDLRTNTLQATRDQVMQELAPARPAPAAIAPHGIRIPPIAGAGRHPNVQAEGAFQKGWFEVQDEGSQIVAALAAAHVDGAPTSDRVLDYCAGAGGKTLALSAQAENAGQIYAFDAEKVRLAPIYDRLRRAGCRNVEVISNEHSLAPLEGQMDLVVVDAPCTGSGTWRRRPDAKWRLSDRQLETRRNEQIAILDKASRYVREGGRLAYITCSIFDDENGRQIDAFLSRHPDFHVESPTSLWQVALNADPSAARFDEARGLSLSPARTGTDGFYFSALRRSAA